MAVAVLVVVTCRVPGSTTSSLRLYLILAGVVLVVRLVFQIVFAAQVPGSGLVVMPLPTWRLGNHGLTLFGPLYLEVLYNALRDAMRLATLIICVGAAACLASPKKTLAALPGALRHVGTAVVVALTVFPQLASAVVRVRRTAALRGPAPNRRSGVLRVVFPVLADSLDRSLELAASLEARGYGRVVPPSRAVRYGRTVAMLVGTSLLAGGMIAWTGTLPIAAWLGPTAVLVGVGALALSWYLLGQGHQHTRFRPQPWTWAEWLVVASGGGVAVSLILTSVTAPGALNPTVLAWPDLPWPALAGLVLAGLPLLLALPVLATKLAPDEALSLLPVSANQLSPAFTAQRFPSIASATPSANATRPAASGNAARPAPGPDTPQPAPWPGELAAPGQEPASADALPTVSPRARLALDCLPTCGFTELEAAQRQSGAAQDLETKA